MREIKFRGKAITENGIECSPKWVYGNLIVADNGDCFITQWKRTEGVGYYSTTYQIIPESKGQFTGLHAKNGEIYEGDILKQTYHAVTGSYDDGMTFDGYHIGAVVITASQGVAMKKPLCYSEETDETTVSNQYKRVAGYRCEVIGNIYENPELLQAS